MLTFKLTFKCKLLRATFRLSFVGPYQTLSQQPMRKGKISEGSNEDSSKHKQTDRSAGKRE